MGVERLLGALGGLRFCKYTPRAVVYNSSLRHGYCNHSASSWPAHNIEPSGMVHGGSQESVHETNMGLIQIFLQAYSLPQDRILGKEHPAAHRIRIRQRFLEPPHQPSRRARCQLEQSIDTLVIVCMIKKSKGRMLQYVTGNRAWSKKPSLSITARTALRSVAPESSKTAPIIASNVVAIIPLETTPVPGSLMIQASNPNLRPRAARRILVTESSRMMAFQCTLASGRPTLHQ